MKVIVDSKLDGGGEIFDAIIEDVEARFLAGAYNADDVDYYMTRAQYLEVYKCGGAVFKGGKVWLRTILGDVELNYE